MDDLNKGQVFKNTCNNNNLRKNHLLLLAVSLEPENADYSNNRQMLLRESGNYLNAINDAKRSVYLAKVIIPLAHFPNEIECIVLNIFAACNFGF